MVVLASQAFGQPIAGIAPERLPSPDAPSVSLWMAPQLPQAEPVLPSTLARPETLTGEPMAEELLLDGRFPADRSEPWEWQVLPVGIIYRSYLAGYKESRFASVWNYQRDWGGLWDIALGARAGVLRYGTTDPIWPEGFQLDIEGAAFPRLDLDEERDLVACDYRFGVPLTYREGRWEYKFGYYHLSSHLGDEYMIKNPSVPRINYVRENLILGVAWFQTPWLRWYTEIGWAFSCDVAEPWEFQFGADYAPPGPTGFRGAPFWALNAYLREEVDYGGNFVAQVGWAWRGAPSGHLFRIGFEYYNGKASQFEFYDQFEDKIGLGMWYDF